jgi:hypothetical protein
LKIGLRFKSVDDWSRAERGIELVEILSSFGLHITKAGSHEPLQRDFAVELLPELWHGRGLPGQHQTCFFLFKGDRTHPFAGIVEWSKDLGPTLEAFNFLALWITVKASVSPDPLVALADRLFAWSRGVYGFVSLKELSVPPVRPDGAKRYLPGVYWVNYFGRPYLEDPGFTPPLGAVEIPGGIRFRAAASPSDSLLADREWRNQIVTSIGQGWYGEGPVEQYRAPRFDFSALRRR